MVDDGSTDGTRRGGGAGRRPALRRAWWWPTRRTPGRAERCSGPSPPRAARSSCSSTGTWTCPPSRCRPWSPRCAGGASTPCSGPSGPPWSPGATPGPAGCCRACSPRSPASPSASRWRRPRPASRPSAGSRWRAALPRVQIGRYSFDLELVVLMHRAGCRIGEFPVELKVQASTSRVTVGTLWEMGRDTVRLWFRTIAPAPALTACRSPATAGRPGRGTSASFGTQDEHPATRFARFSPSRERWPKTASAPKTMRQRRRPGHPVHDEEDRRLPPGPDAPLEPEGPAPVEQVRHLGGHGEGGGHPPEERHRQADEEVEHREVDDRC